MYVSEGFLVVHQPASLNVSIKVSEEMNSKLEKTYKTSQNMIFRHDVHKFCEPVRYDFGQFLSSLINKYTNGENHPNTAIIRYSYSNIEVKDKIINAIACVYMVPFDRIYKSYTRSDKLLIGDPQNASATIPDHVEPETRNKRSDQPHSRSKRFLQHVDFMTIQPEFFQEHNITSMPDLVVAFNNTIALVDGTNCSRPHRTALDSHGWQFILPTNTNCASGFCKTLICSKSAIVFSFNYNTSNCLFGKADDFISTTCMLFQGQIIMVKFQIMDLNDMLNKRTGADAIDLYMQEVFSGIGPWKVFDSEINREMSVSSSSAVVDPISESTDHQNIWTAILIALLFLSLSANFFTVLYRVGGLNAIQQYKLRYSNSEGGVVESNKQGYVVIGLLGEGGFGAVYKVHLQEDKTREYAMKIAILKLVGSARGEKSHFTRIVDRGKKSNFFFIVMQLVGRSLADLKHQAPTKSFSIGTALGSAKQSLEAIEDLHGHGFVHRDIKPANYACGLGEQKHVIYILDFGIARRLIKSNNELKTPRQLVGFKGTLRFASLTCHRGEEIGKKDDCESWFYLLMELIQPSGLPWRKMSEKSEVKECKIRCRNEGSTEQDQLYHKQKGRTELIKIITYIDQLRYEHPVDYSYIYELLKLVSSK
ncbi:Protein kinase domain-containing protein [Aphelenchoides besseyi]|nr:Protein kinase domain-containing protein [Aphelenchoides besseyi]